MSLIFVLWPGDRQEGGDIKRHPHSHKNAASDEVSHQLQKLRHVNTTDGCHLNNAPKAFVSLRHISPEFGFQGKSGKFEVGEKLLMSVTKEIV